MVRFSLVLALATLSLVPGCPLLEAEIEVPEVCITYDELEVLAVPEIHQRIVVDDLAEIQDLIEHAETLRFRRAEAIAVSGIDGFDFVDTARIAIAPGADDASIQPLTLYACDGDCVSHAESLALSDDEQLDVLGYLRGDAITLDLDLTGELPPVRWTMSVVVCFEATARFQVDP